MCTNRYLALARRRSLLFPAGSVYNSCKCVQPVSPIGMLRIRRCAAWWCAAIAMVTLTLTVTAAGGGKESDPLALCSRGVLACPDSGRALSLELAGLTITDIVEVQDQPSRLDVLPVQRTWEAVSRQFRSRAGGVLQYDYGVPHCSEWLYGPPKRSELISVG